MSQEHNLRIAQELLAALGAEEDADKIAAMFSTGVQFEIAGDIGALPWIGRRTGRSAVSGFILDTRRLTDRLRFDVQDVLASEERAVIVGELTSKIKATGKIVETAFALILTISGGEITRFQMLEDSFGVSRAARS